MGVRLQNPGKEQSQDLLFSRILEVHLWAIPSVKSSKFRGLEMAISGKTRSMGQEDPFLETLFAVYDHS